MKPEPQPPVELLVLPDGRILAHHLTPELAAVLAECNPSDEAMRKRAGQAPSRPLISHENPTGN
jgi:hypothetical protein